MNIRTKIRLGVVAAVMAATPLRAGIIYQCDFEDATENGQWHLMNTSPRGDVATKWYIGQEGNFSLTGHAGLYISSDEGATATYARGKNLGVLAYRELTLPVGSYVLDFDWRAMGSNLTSLMVAWVPQSQTTNSNPSGNASNNLTNLKMGGLDLRGSRTWHPQRFSFTVTAADTQGKLVFIWQQGLDNADPKTPGACVDNIIIADAPLSICSAPTDLKYTTAKAQLSWKGSADYYQVRDYCQNDGSITEYDSVAATSMNMTLNSEGTHTFFVRGVCGDESNVSEWVSVSQFVWIPGIRCIDYLDLGANPSFKGVCYVGDFEEFIINGRQGTLGKVDMGSGSDESMHTIHTNINEIDPNTTVGGGLNTVPEGEVASVRLGAYTSSGQSARVEYKYHVQQGMSDLLDLKYAVVMESGDHGEDYRVDGDQQPSFRLDVLDGNGRPLASKCTSVDFICGFGDAASWHVEPGATYGQIWWCDWQTITVSLRPYVGQTLTIRLTSTRCSYDTHFTKAYFTMGCRSGDLEGLACGDFSTDHFTAPEGFDYKWYKEADPQHKIISTDQTLHISPDNDSIYMVECWNKDVDDCYFTLTANPNPRFPMAQGDTIVSHVDCQNVVTFTNNSVVRVVSRKDSSTMSIDEPIYTVFFDYGDGTTEEVKATQIKHVYPETGGHFEAMMIAMMNDGVCQDTLRYSIDLPDLLHTGTYNRVDLCRGENFQLPNGEFITEDTIYVTYSQNKYGCDAPNELAVYFHDSVSAVTDTTFCEGGYIDFEGQRYTETGTYRVELLTQYGCDSTLTLNLNVLPRLELDVPDTVETCGDFGHGEFITIPVSVLKGRYNGVDIYIDNGTNMQHPFDSIYSFGPEEEIMIPVPDSVRPNYYNVMLDPSTDDCPTDSLYITMVLKYSNLILDSKQGFIVLFNENYNYGEFEYVPNRYKWYRNGELLEGENQSYIHVSEADLGSDFYVEMVRADDGVNLPSCPMTYERPTDLQSISASQYVYPTLLSPGQTMTVVGSGAIAIVDVLGRVVETMFLGADALHTTSMNAPDKNGVYFIKIADYEAVKILVR